MTEDFMVSVPARIFASILTERDGYKESYRLNEEERRELKQEIRELRKRIESTKLDLEVMTGWFHQQLEEIAQRCPHYDNGHHTCRYLALKLLAEIASKPVVHTEQEEFSSD